MSTPIEVKLSEVQKKLDELEEAHKENQQQRACLFNLIVYTFDDARFSFYENLVTQITKQFPCRILFVKELQNSNEKEIKAFVSARMTGSSEEKNIVYEQINLETPAHLNTAIPPYLLAHLVADLPIFLIWTKDPNQPHPAFEPLKTLADRLLFEAECSSNIHQFAQNIKDHLFKHQWQVCDLNWLRLDSWKKVIQNVFRTAQQYQELQSSAHWQMTYRAIEGPFCCQNPFTVHYFHAWLASILGYKPKQAETKQDIQKIVYQKPDQSELVVELKKDSHSCQQPEQALISTQFTLESKKTFKFHLLPDQPLIQVEICNDEKNCQIYNSFSVNTKWEHSLAREMCYQGTSPHYYKMLEILSLIKDLP